MYSYINRYNICFYKRNKLRFLNICVSVCIGSFTVHLSSISHCRLETIEAKKGFFDSVEQHFRAKCKVKFVAVAAATLVVPTLVLHANMILPLCDYWQSSELLRIPSHAMRGVGGEAAATLTNCFNTLLSFGLGGSR